ncbi:MAG: lactate racemase domain-containing protein [Spirochaetaceae bacterium]|nr:lactate racemase domain-containing protein [Spirochaetaceae bacterium]
MAVAAADKAAASRSAIERILADVPLPEVVPVRQSFPASPIGDLPAAVRDALAEGGLAGMVRPRQRVALAVGSRGLANLPELVRLLAAAVRRLGAQPFVVPAMGSHGGATAEGQTQLLAKMGVTEAAVGAPIRASMDVVALGQAAPGLPAFGDKLAAQADATLMLGRVKPHSSFRGRYESGLIKMLAIGLGKQKGAETCHTRGFGALAERIAAVGKTVLARGNVAGGLAVVENARHQTHHVELVPAAAIPEREPALLKLAWDLYPRLPFDQADVLVLGRVGKEISGTGLDCNVVGRYTTPYASGGPDITRIVALDTTPLTGGNVNGIGVVDVTTERLFTKFSFAETYPNALTSTATAAVKIPMVMPDDRLAIQAAIRTATIPDPAAVRLAWVRDTLSLDRLHVSANMAAEIAARPDAAVTGPAQALRFTPAGHLDL